jgi:hypothetical protein
MLLHFDRTLVERLLDHAEAAPKHRALHQQGAAEPALWVVGDDGVYILSNGEPILPANDDGVTSLVCYADECDPHRLEFSQWWEAKRASFGPDDGAEFFDAVDIRTALATYQPGEPLVIDCSPEGIGLVAYRAVVKLPTAPKPAAKAARKSRKRPA